MKDKGKATIENEPWNKGKAVGQMTPFNPDQADLIRTILKSDHATFTEEAANHAANNKSSKSKTASRKALGALRDLAMFNTGIDTMLRASDLLKLRVIDVADHEGNIIEEFSIRQKKTKNPQVVALSHNSRESLKAWISATGKSSEDFLFTSIGNRNNGGPLSRNQYANLVKKWASHARLDPKRHSTHSMRRSKSAAVYEKTHNLRACQHLLGHKSIASTASYLAVDQREALDLAKKIKI